MSLQVQQLCKEFFTESGSVKVLAGIDLSLDDGASLSIMGPSGSGKSTLLHILGGLEKPTSGNYLLDGKNPLEGDEQSLALFRNQKVGFVFQDHHLLPQCTVLENVLIPALVSKAKENSEKWALDLLGRVGLSHRVTHFPSELSGGERQRVAVARALFMKPRVLLADEPTGNLDRKNAESVMDLLIKLHREENNILIVVTHSPELAAKFPVQKIMQDGVLLDQGKN